MYVGVEVGLSLTRFTCKALSF